MNFKRALTGPPESPQEAFHQLVYSFGVADMAKLISMKPGTLYNKADADPESHNQPTLRDVLLVTQISGDMRVLDALDEHFGRAAFDVTRMEQVSDAALLDLLAKLGKESGEFHSALHSALQDPSFRAAKLNTIRAEAFDMVSALMTLVARLEGLVDE